LVAANSTVTLYVSTGPAKKPVPDVIGKKELDAESELTNAGFKVGKPRTDPSSSQPQGTVIDQSPAGNTLAKPGITVTITVSGGGISVPNVIGQSLQTAEGTLRADNLSYRVKFVPAQPGTTPGTVVGQSPAPPKTVPPGTQITLTVAQEQTPTPTATPTPTDTSPSPTPTDSKGH
jgi:serine/threonine-protein kinase